MPLKITLEIPERPRTCPMPPPPQLLSVGQLSPSLGVCSVRVSTFFDEAILPRASSLASPAHSALIDGLSPLEIIFDFFAGRQQPGLRRTRGAARGWSLASAHLFCTGGMYPAARIRHCLPTVCLSRTRRDVWSQCKCHFRADCKGQHINELLRASQVSCPRNYESMNQLREHSLLRCALFCRILQ